MGQRVSLASHIQTDGVSDRQKTDRSRSSTGKHGSLSAGNRFGLSDNSRMVSGDDSYGGSHGPDRIRKKEHIHKVSGRVISGRRPSSSLEEAARGAPSRFCSLTRGKSA